MAETVRESKPNVRLALEPPPGRLERLQAWMHEERLDCVVALGADPVNYLCGYWRYYGGPSALVVGPDGERTLAVMRDETTVAQELGEADTVVGYGVRGFGIELNPLPLLADAITGVDAVATAGRIGIADGLGDAVAVLSRRLDGELVDADAVLAQLRLRKDPDELTMILHAYELCWLGQRAVSEAAQRGASEIEMFTAALSAAQIANGGPIEFLADLLSGPNTAAVCCPIHVAGTRSVEPGEPVIADVVVRAHGYWGDSAETHLAGENAAVAEARATLLEILAQAGSELRPGANGAAIFHDMAARIEAAFPGGEFPHHGGHALGLTSFEGPHLIPADETPLDSWMVIAVEPGVYFPGRFGARVENVFVVTPEGGVELREAVGAGS
jgi:Xaa-Pro aminopeptidase